MKPLTLPPVRPNLGLQHAYKRRLEKLIEAMNKSVQYWLKASYKANEPHMAMDELPATMLKKSVNELQRRWQKQFNDASKDLAKYFAQTAASRSDKQLQEILKRGGMTVKFKMTPAARDIMNATINEQVSLIKAIPQKYFTQVQGSVMRSVQTGRDLGTLSAELQDTYGVTKRRAALIARDQNNKATSAMTRARQVELGISEAIWVHSHGGKKPRPTHLRNDGERYDVTKGWLDPAEGKFIFPGELINCRCVSRSVIQGFS